MKEKYTITGMNCASCANHVQSAVSKVNGVSQCEVNLLLNQMVIEKEDMVDDSAIINAVVEAGYGAELYSPLAKQDKKSLQSVKKRLIISIVLMFPLSYIAMGSMLSLPEIPFINKTEHPLLNCLVQFILSFSIYIINRKRILTGLKQLLRFKPTMDSLIGLGCFASLIYSLSITEMIFLNPQYCGHLVHQLCYETGAMVLVFSSIGKYLEELSKTRTTSAISNLISITPNNAIRIVNGKNVKITVEEVQIDDLLLIKPGAKVPVDGIVVEGHSYNDQSALTGESVPVEKQVGDSLISGALNLNGILKMKAQKAFTDSTFSKVLALVQEAANSKAPISRLADRISLYFVPTVISLSLLTFVLWKISGADFDTAFNHAMSVLVVSCPCALGLATPTAVMVCTGKAAKMGILYKNAAVIEETSKIDTLVFDKTNTITQGRMILTNLKEIVEIDDFISILYTLEKDSEHPLSKAIIDYCLNKKALDLGFDHEYLIGKGLTGTYRSDIYRIGNLALMKMNDIDLKGYESYCDDEATILYFSKNNALIALISVKDPLKPQIIPTLQRLSSYDKIMLSGDNEITAKAIAQQCGISKVYASVLPDGKQEVIKELQKEHKVAMIGDGINDSVALMQADVGIAINNATDIAVEASDAVLLSNQITDLVNLLSLSKYAMKIIRQNLFWALGYNCILIPIAAGVFSGLGLNLSPMLSSLCMSLSSITVVSNALRINRFRPFQISQEKDTGKKTYILSIDHMMCEHCQRAVENALLNLGILSSTDLPTSTCKVITSQDLNIEAITAELEKAGYKLSDYKIID